jgi:mRNA-degrading endonuclease HigB of HigAB toxin-antitoxin module
VEIWKNVVGFEGVFIVSNLGRIMRLKCRFAKEDRLLRPHISKRGYYVYNLCYKGKNKICNIHRLVAQAFIPNPENKREVNHKDSNKLNNDISNLEWATPKENSMHACRSQKSKHQKNKRGAYKNVYKEKIRWASQIVFENKNIYLGFFETKDEAHCAYFKKFKDLYGFEPWVIT